jgi:two-component system phosphate regulon sensor histidine kinase PhoR
MNLKKANLFVIFSTIALLGLMAIQVFWIWKTASIKESIFNEKANMVLARTTEVLVADKQTCKSISNCIDENSQTELTPIIAKNDLNKIDSLLHHYMHMYNIHIDYKFNIVRQNNQLKYRETSLSNAIFQATLNDIAIEKGIDIKLIFPDRKQYILAEMGWPFFSSILLIITMMIIFWRTNLSLMHEKKIAFHTKEFLNNMSHEFKTPLANIALAAKMVNKENTINDINKINHYTSIILAENEKLNRQIDQVLKLNALEKDEIFVQNVELDFHAIIHNALDEMRMPLELQQSSIHLNLSATKEIIKGDKEQLNSLLCNLIDNAIKYSNPPFSLVIETCNTEHYLQMVFKDNGIGIHPEFHKKVFEKYFRVPTHNLHQVKGFGLGLSYIKKIIEIHQGEITLESELGKGTTFIIKLPYA